MMFSRATVMVSSCAIKLGVGCKARQCLDGGVIGMGLKDGLGADECGVH